MDTKTKKSVSFENLDTVDLAMNPRESQISHIIEMSEENIREKEHRRRMRRIFDNLDKNRNGFLEINELKTLIKSVDGKAIPKSLATRLLKLSDTNRDGRLDFDEFYEMSRTYYYILNTFINSYCNKLVPPRATYHADQTDGRYEENYSCCPPPITMLIFSLIEIITFSIDVWYKDEHKQDDASFSTVGKVTNGPLAQVMIYDPSRRDEIWRFITYMFVHAGTSHLTANLVIQLFLGTALELVHCWWRIVCIYLSGIFAASIGTSVWNPKTKFCGASGGVYALVTAHIATVILNWKDMDHPGIQLFVFTFYCTVDLGQSIYNHLSNPYFDQVGYIGHLCGAVSGLLVGIGVLRNISVKSWETKLWWVCVLIYLSLILAGIYVHVLYPDHFHILRPKVKYFEPTNITN